MHVQCSSYDAGRCRSCSLLDLPYPTQLSGKEARVRDLLAASTDASTAWLPSVASAPDGFRNKAKMVVGGTARRPTLGILDPRGRGVDLRECPLHTPGIVAALPVLAAFVTRAGLDPYDVPARRGELKHVLVTESPDGELMVRFVVRSAASITAVRRALPGLQRSLPALAVVSVNLLPDHRAVLEGEEEVVLTARATLPMRLGDLTLHLRPRSFFQTNTPVARELYAQAAAWADRLDPSVVQDLYCGVGGFALHLAGAGREVVGVETSEDAVRSARTSARQAGLAGVRFVTGDASQAAFGASPPDLVVVNPPRRGIGADLAAQLERSGAPSVVYSSCNPASLAKDLAAMPSLRPREVRVFDMFPNTDHCEVAVLLQRGASSSS